MATITLTIGPTTSTITASNAKAAKVIENSVLLHGYEGDITDAQMVADFFMAEIKRVVNGWSRQYEENAAIENAVDAVLSDPDIIFEP